MNAFRLAWAELSRFGHGPLLRRLVPLTLILIPTLYGVLYLWSNWDPYGKLGDVPVAVVNLDRPVEVLGKQVDAGAMFVSELRHDTTLGWRFVDARQADKGVADGSYAFAVIVPADFSAKLASPLSGKPERAEIRLQLNDANGYIVGKVAETAELEIKNKVDEAAFRAYTEGVLDQLLVLHDQLDTAANGAGELTTGAGEASDGARALDDGLGELASGAQQLASGAGQVADGTQQLVAALAAARAAVDAELIEVAQTIIASAQALQSTASGAVHLADRLVSDVTAAKAAVAELCQGDDSQPCRDLRAGAEQAERDSKRLAGALRLLGADLGVLASTSPTDLARLRALLIIDTRALTDTADAATAAADDAASLAAITLQRIQQRCQGDTGPICRAALDAAAKAEQLAKELAGAQYGAGAAVHRLAELAFRVDSQLDEVIAQVTQGSSQVQQLADGASQVSTGANQLSAGLGQAEPGAAELAAGLTALTNGARELASGLAAGAAQIPQLDSDTRQRTVDVLGSPVALRTTNMHPANVYGRGLAPFFFAIALWVFGLIAYQLLRTVNPRALAALAPAFPTAVGGWLPAAVLGSAGALVLYLVSDLGLGLRPLHPLGTIGLMVLGVATFVAIAQLLKLAFGVVGELLTLVLLMLQLTSSGGLYPMQTAPALFRALHPFLPMTYLVDGLRVTISGGMGSHLSRDVLILAGFLAMTLAVSTLVVVRKRRWTVSGLMPAIEMDPR